MTAEPPSVEIIQQDCTPEGHLPKFGQTLFYFYVDVAKLSADTDRYDAFVAASRINEPMSDLEEALRYADA